MYGKFCWLIAGLVVSGLLCVSAFSASNTADLQSPELLSQLMQRVSATPEFRDRMLQATSSVPKIGEWLSPGMADDLRKAILGGDWHRVDHFPGLTVAALNRSVDVTAHVAEPSRATSKKQLTVADLLDVGDYADGRAAEVDLGRRVAAPTFAEDAYDAVTHPAPGLTMGDGPDPALAPMHPESARLARVLNRLALNSPSKPQLIVMLAGKKITDAGALIAALQASGHEVGVDDDLYFANFGHLHDGARDVMMPFWIDTQIAVPGEGRSLLVPVSHSEHEIHVRGPLVNADVSYYFGIDGKSEFRTMDSLNQAWVLGRKAFVYRGDRAVQVVGLLAQATRVYLAVRLAHPELPFGGYYKLGVCQDTNAAIELQMQGRVLLFPLTHDARYFPVDPGQLHLEARDGQFLRLMAAIPSDRSEVRPPVARVLGCLPTTNAANITIPGLAADLLRVERARQTGLLRRTHPLMFALLGVLTIAVLGVGGLCWRRRRVASA